jgi:cyclophilin family peptidyl-prolyl cis-trans isomerase/HEAT repeat protein
LLSFLVASCHERRGDERTATAAPIGPEDPRLTAIRGAEAARSTDAVPAAASTDRDVRVRRSAARALARIGDGAASERLERGLSDEDPEVVAWSAYGLGQTCDDREAAVVRSLVARAASLVAGPPGPASGGGFDLAPAPAIADALGRCGTALAETTLRAWLDGPKARAEAAALALGRIAVRRRRLDDATVVALLDAAVRATPLEGALYPLGRVDPVSGSVAARLVEVAKAVVARGGTAQLFAIRALAASGGAGADLLASVLVDETATSEARSAAASVLGRLGSPGQPALAHALGTVVTAGGDLGEKWLRPRFGPLTAALRALLPKSGAEDALVRLAELPLPAGGDAALIRRVVSLRCDAAGVLANTASLSARLVACAGDGDGHARLGALAILRVLDRGELVGARFEAWKKFAGSEDPAVRRAALAVVSNHVEMPPISGLLAHALGAHEAGTVAQAARVLAADPRRGGKSRLAAAPSTTVPGTGADAVPDEAVVNALAAALDAPRPADEIETRVALSAAAGALAALRLKPRVEKLCASDNVTVRRGAESALRALGSDGAQCPSPRSKLPAKSATPVTGAQHADTLTFVTDNGRLGLTLDPTFAPLAVERIVELAKSGFYDHVAIHRVVPGFVVQFGDPVGDGYGGAGRAPLPSENAPHGFARLAVGMALAGRDTGSSQVFVTLASEPSLDGDYPLLGFADAAFTTAAEGDVIDHVEIRDADGVPR